MRLPRRATTGAAGAVLTLLAAGLATSLTSPAASADPARTDSGSRSGSIEVIAKEKVTIDGTLPGATRRPVVLEQEVGGEWLAVTGANASATGAYTFTVTAPATAASFRVAAPRALVAGAPAAAWQSDPTTTVPVAQTGTMTGPVEVPLGQRAQLTATFTPIRAGRTVDLQALQGSAWTTVGTRTVNNQGQVTFSAAPKAATKYRAVAAAYNGAAAKASNTVAVKVGPGGEQPGGDTPWVTGYYAGWFWDQMYPPEKVDMSAMTHFVFGRVAPGGGSLAGDPGTVVEGAGTAHEDGLSPDGERSVEDYLVKKAHDADTKALLMLGGDGGDGRGFLASSRDDRRATFVDNVVDYLVEHDYDGVDVDWENCLSGEQGCGENVSAAENHRRVRALLGDLREEMDSRPEFADEPGILTFPGYAVNTNWLEPGGKVEQWQADIANMVDQYNLMSYGVGTTWSGGGWHSWFTGALKGAYGNAPVDLETSIQAYVNTGVPRDRLGIGIGFYGIYYGPSIDGPREPTEDEPIYEVNDVALSYYELDRKGYLDHGTLRWDDEASSTYRIYGGSGYVPSVDPGSNPAGMLSYEDPRSIQAKGDWVKETGVGGTILWTLNYGYLPESGTNPLLAAVKESFLN